MKRRDFLALAGASAVVWPRVAVAQQAAKVPRVAVLFNSTTGTTDAPLSASTRQAFDQGLADLGYIDGKTITLETFGAPTIADVPAYAARAVASKPDLILTVLSAAPLALKDLGTTIPVVFTALQDPVAIGLVASYAHPGGTMTGNMLAGPDYAGKQMSIIRETMPGLTRLALFGLPADPPYPVLLAQVQAATKALNIETVLIETKEGDPFPPLFDRAVQGGAQAIYAIAAAYLTAAAGANTAALASLGIKYRLPMFGASANAASGFLLGYGSNTPDVQRRAMSYVAAILKGANPADLPVEQPTTFDFVVNLKTAKAIGFLVPASILAQATQVIE